MNNMCIPDRMSPYCGEFVGELPSSPDISTREASYHMELQGFDWTAHYGDAGVSNLGARALGNLLAGRIKPGTACLITSEMLQGAFDRIIKRNSNATENPKQIFDLLKEASKDGYNEFYQQALDRVIKIYSGVPKKFLSEAYKNSDLQVVSYFFDGYLKKISDSDPRQNNAGRAYSKLFSLLEDAPLHWQETIAENFLQSFREHLKKYDISWLAIEHIVTLASGLSNKPHLALKVLKLADCELMVNYLLEHPNDENHKLLNLLWDQIPLTSDERINALKTTLEVIPTSSNAYKEAACQLWATVGPNESVWQSLDTHHGCSWVKFLMSESEEDLHIGEWLLKAMHGSVATVRSRASRKALEGELSQAYRTLLDKLASAPSESRGIRMLELLDGSLGSLMNNLHEMHHYRAQAEIMKIKAISNLSDVVTELQRLIYDRTVSVRAERIEALLEQLSHYNYSDLLELDKETLQDLHTFLGSYNPSDVPRPVGSNVGRAYANKVMEGASEQIDDDNLRDILSIINSISKEDDSEYQQILGQLILDQPLLLLQRFSKLADDDTLVANSDLREKISIALLEKMTSFQEPEELEILAQCGYRLQELKPALASYAVSQLLAIWSNTNNAAIERDFLLLITQLTSAEQQFPADLSEDILNMLLGLEGLDGAGCLLKKIDPSAIPQGYRVKYLRLASAFVINRGLAYQEEAIALGYNLLRLEDACLKNHPGLLANVINFYLSSLSSQEALVVANDCLGRYLQVNPQDFLQEGLWIKKWLEQAFVLLDQNSGGQVPHQEVLKLLKNLQKYASGNLKLYLAPEQTTLLYWNHYIVTMMKACNFNHLIDVVTELQKLFPHYFTEVREARYTEDMPSERFKSNFTHNIASIISKMTLDSREGFFKLIQCLEKLHQRGFLMESEQKNSLLSKILVNFSVANTDESRNPTLDAQTAWKFLQRLSQTFLIDSMPHITPLAYNSYLVLLLRTIGITTRGSVDDSLVLSPKLAQEIQRAIRNYREDCSSSRTPLALLLRELYRSKRLFMAARNDGISLYQEVYNTFQECLESPQFSNRLRTSREEPDFFKLSRDIASSLRLLSFTKQLGQKLRNA
ncbi:MAG: hypothetical protein ACQEP8_00860 [Chlamydiota bacterium]